MHMPTVPFSGHQLILNPVLPYFENSVHVTPIWVPADPDLDLDYILLCLIIGILLVNWVKIWENAGT